MKIPAIPGELMAYLESQYPDRSPSALDLILEPQQAIARAAKVDLVRSLRVAFDRQNKTVLENK